MTGATRGDDIEVAVFRFTLGIPGFDDALIPRVVGILTGFLMVLNHALSPQPVSDPQIRIEAIGAVRSAVAISAPTLQRRLEELRPGRGRRAAADTVEGATNVFFIDSSVGNNDSNEDEKKKTLAWASYALLKATNICGLAVVLWNERKVVLCRGLLATGTDQAIIEYNNSNTSTSTTNSNAIEYASQSLVLLEDRGSIDKNEVCRKSVVATLLPRGASTVALIPIQPLFSDTTTSTSIGTLVLVSERERSLSGKELKWAQGIASKVYATFFLSSSSPS